MHCWVNSLGQKSSFPSQHIYIHFRWSTALKLILYCEPPLFSNILTADYCDRSLRLDEYLRKAKLSEQGTKCHGKKIGKGRN